MTVSLPTATLHPLTHPDGSSQTTLHGCTVTTSINGPLEVQRRDEVPDRAYIEVLVRPASGQSSPRERWLESILQRTLKNVILVKQFPRTMVQVVCQVVRSPEDLGGREGLAMLPALLMSSILALVDAAIPLRTIFTATLVACGPDVVTAPDARQVHQAQSLHVFAFSGKREMLVAESVGAFDLDEWKQACERAEGICCGAHGASEGMEVDGKEADMKNWLKKVVEEKVEKEQRWRG